MRHPMEVMSQKRSVCQKVRKKDLVMCNLGAEQAKPRMAGTEAANISSCGNKDSAGPIYGLDTVTGFKTDLQL